MMKTLQNNAIPVDESVASSSGSHLFDEISKPSQPLYPEPVDVLDKDPQKRDKARKAYADNFKTLYRNLSGAWFSFGDEKMLQEALYEIASTPQGQNIIANLDPNMPVGTTNFFKGGGLGLYTDGEVIMPANLGDKLGKNELTVTLAHELLHAKQEYLGENRKANLSPRQVLVKSLLREAEAEAWDKAHNLTHIVFSSLHPDREQIATFLAKTPEQLRADVERYAQKENIELSAENLALMQDGLRTFQSTLQKNNGNLYQTQKEIVRRNIPKLMAENTKNGWKEFYEKQGINNLKKASTIFLSAKGDEAEYLTHLNRVSQEYNIPLSKLDVLVISDTAQQQLAQVENAVHMGEKTKINPPHMAMNRNNGGR